MKNIFIGAILFLAVIAQASLFSNFFPTGLVPDIALLIIIIWTARSDFNAVLKWAIVGGLFLDMLSFGTIGVNILSFVTVAFVANSFRKRFLIAQFAWKFLVFAVIITIATALNHAIVTTLMTLSSGSENFFEDIMDHARMLYGREMLFKIMYNLIMFAMIYRPLGKMDKILAYYKK